MKMLVFVQAFFLLFLFCNAPLAAADTSILGQNTCAAGTAGDPSGSKSFAAGGSDVSGAVKSYLTQVELCASACYDETITLSVTFPSLTLNFTTQARNQCKSAPPDPRADNRGCAKGQTQPSVTVHIPSSGLPGVNAQTIGPKSRCLAAVTNTIGTLTQGGISAASVNASSLQSALTAINNAPAQATPIPSTGSIAGNSDLVAALTNSGVPPTAAQTLAADPSSAQALINAYATGNTDTIQDTIQDAAAKANIQLNDGVYNNIANLSSSQLQNAQTALTPLADNSGTAIVGSDTFSQNGPPALSTKGGANAPMIAQTEQQYGLSSGLLSNMCYSESRCQPTTCYQGNQNSACGMYQYIPSTWTSVTAQMCAQGVSSVAQYCSGSSIPLSYRSDAYVSTQVAGWNISQNLQQYGSLISQTGINQGTAAYIMQGLGTPAASAFFQAYTQNPNMSTVAFLQQYYANNPGLVSSIVANNGNLYNGQTLQGTVNQFAANLGATAPASSAYASTAAGNAGSPFSITAGAGFGSGSQAVSYTPLTATSPFASMSSIYATAGLGSGQSLVSNGSITPILSTGNTGSSGAGTPATPIARITAQPSAVQVNGLITVSWSSGGMSAAVPCKVFESGNSLPIAQQNNGTRAVAATTTGAVVFNLACTSSVNGATITAQSQTVIIH